MFAAQLRPPSPLVLFFAAFTAVAGALAFIKGFQDPDFFWHYMNGRFVAETGSMPVRDPFSFTHAGGHRTPHEWASELLMYLLVESLGPDMSLALFALALPIGFASLAWSLVGRGLSARAIALGTIPSAAVAIPYATVRPQVLSWMLLAVLLALLISLDATRPRRALWVVPLFAVWANVHGLWAVGAAVVGWYTLFTLLGRTPMSAAWRWMVASAVLGVAAASLSPEGPATLLYPLRFLNPSDWGLANIPEWRSPNFHDAVQLPLLALIVLLALNGGRGAPGWLVGLSWIGVAMALIANRNAPVAAVFAVPVLAIGVQARLRSQSVPAESDRLALGRRLVEAGVAALVIVGALLSIPPNVKGISLDRYPDEAIDLLVQRQPNARVLSEYGWGGYVMYRLHDLGGRVFVDGRNDLYPEAILEDYTAMRDAEPGWESLLDRYRVDVILFRPRETIVKGPAELAGWCEVYRDEHQVMLLRDCE